MALDGHPRGQDSGRSVASEFAPTPASQASLANHDVDRRPIPAHIGAVVHAQVTELTEVTLLTTTPIVVNFAAPIHSSARLHH
jgi:hypothetical protein